MRPTWMVISILGSMTVALLYSASGNGRREIAVVILFPAVQAPTIEPNVDRGRIFSADRLAAFPPSTPVFPRGVNSAQTDAGRPLSVAALRAGGTQAVVAGLRALAHPSATCDLRTAFRAARAKLELEAYEGRIIFVPDVALGASGRRFRSCAGSPPMDDGFFADIRQKPVPIDIGPVPASTKAEWDAVLARQDVVDLVRVYAEGEYVAPASHPGSHRLSRMMRHFRNVLHEEGIKAIMGKALEMLLHLV